MVQKEPVFFQSNLIKLMEVNGMNQKALADALQMSQAHASLLCHGKRGANIHAARAISKLFSVTIEQLMFTDLTNNAAQQQPVQ